MNRLTNTLEELKNKSKKALVAYLVAGDPDIETTLELMTVLVESGVDIIEIGVPFTDPIAEGPIIQKAHDRALKNNVSLKSIFEMVDKFRKNNNDTPLVLNEPIMYPNTCTAKDSCKGGRSHNKHSCFVGHLAHCQI